MTRRTSFASSLLCVLNLFVPSLLFAVPNSAVFNGATTTVDLGSISINAPAGVAVDASGDTYLTDTTNSRIVKVGPDGTASVFAITGLSPGLASPRGISTDAAGNLY